VILRIVKKIQSGDGDNTKSNLSQLVQTSNGIKHKNLFGILV